MIKRYDDAATIAALEQAALEIRKQLLTLCAMQSLHIGGDLSSCDVMTALWQYQMYYNKDNPRDEGRDRFVLSKGHASAVMSFNQAAIGCFSADDVMSEYAQDGGRFTMHSCALVNPFVEVSTGSLGHGMPVAAGIAAALRLKGNYKSRVYTLMGDGEQSEGSVWEAAMNAAHYKLGNLIAILDNNGLEADGAIDSVTGLGDIAQKYKVSGWNTIEIDGNDMISVKKAFDTIPPASSAVPTIIVCHTVKGKGVDFMEGQVKWHAGKITEAQRDDAIKQVEDSFAAKQGRSA